MQRTAQLIGTLLKLAQPDVHEPLGRAIELLILPQSLYINRGKFLSTRSFEEFFVGNRVGINGLESCIGFLSNRFLKENRTMRLAIFDNTHNLTMYESGFPQNL